jgi:L-threonylcarbamoyladenylate synthase
VSSADEAVQAIRGGRAAVLPFDTVYGLAADARSEEPVRALYRVKGRATAQPSALVARDVDYLLELVPELAGRAETVARALLPGAFTLIFRNPARRFTWLTGRSPETIGVRVPVLPPASAYVLETVAAVVATSANRPGERDPAALDEVPAEIRARAVTVDGGRLPGTPSTVLDCTVEPPAVLRDGAAPAAEALRRLGAAVRSG